MAPPVTVEAPAKRPIGDRILDLETTCKKSLAHGSALPLHLYVGEDEYHQLREELVNMSVWMRLLPTSISDYDPGSSQIFGLKIFVVRAVKSHLAIA